jgi:hypothetical protein
MPESRYVQEMITGDLVGKPITAAQARYEAWLAARGWQPAADSAPFCSQEGGYLFTTDPLSVVSAYVEENPGEGVFYRELESHAYEVGEMVAPPDDQGNGWAGSVTQPVSGERGSSATRRVGGGPKVSLSIRRSSTT